ncbi:LysR substrate-binding domain-containing protein [Plesiomonas sp.]|uniref:LysR substrate-binding domain-containing protein n=1 Tax=Plesiomonas sp. TaxID=2486279 RepID=UPI003F3623E0
MSLTLKQLKVFSAIALHGNMTQASEALFLTKPALSMALQELERQLGQRLFDRVNNRLHLNSQGKRLLPMADELLQRSQLIEQTFKQDTELSGSLYIGASNTIGNYMLPTMLGAFITRHPECAPHITIDNTHVLAGKLTRFELDMALVEGGLHDPQLILTDWQHDEMWLVVSPQHPLALCYQQQGVLSLADFEDQYWIVRELGSGSRESFNQAIALHLDSWHLRLELNQSEAILGACRAGLGIGYMPAVALATDIMLGTLCRLPISLPTQRQLRMAVHRDKYVSPLLRCFMDFCMQWPDISSQELNR